MPITLQVFENARADLIRLAARLNPREAGAVAGRAVTNLVRTHLFKRNRERPNKLGGKRTHWAAQAARATQFRVVSDGAVVSVNHLGIRQQLEGGVILPVRRKYLTIPMVPEAHGRRASEFDDLEFAIVPGVGPALVRALRTAIRIGKRGVRAVEIEGGEVVFRLARRVRQEGDPTWLPGGDEMVESAASALRSFYQRQVDRRRTA